MGSRYGGNKQLDEVGPAGETIIDYSIYDAIRSGFGKIVFVIRHDIEEQVKERFVEKLRGRIEVDYVFQEITNLPEGVQVSPERAKPWGTSHAILVAENKIKEPFGVINAHDYYGVESFKILHDFLVNDTDPNCYSIVGYKLGNTLSEHGTSTGVCVKLDLMVFWSILSKQGSLKRHPMGPKHRVLTGKTSISQVMRWSQ